MVEKNRAYYMRQGRFLYAMVAADDQARIQSEFKLYEFKHINEARKFDASTDDGWIVGG